MEGIDSAALSADGRNGIPAALLVARIRSILWIALVAGLTFTALELAFAPRLAAPFVIKCIGLSLTTAAIASVRGAWVTRHALGVALAVIAAAYGLTALSGIVSPSREYETTAVLFVGGALTTATLLPWGLWLQSITVFAGAALLCFAVYWADGDLHVLYDDPGAAVTIGLGISLVTARELQRYRLASLRELAARQRAELALRALNTDLEGRVSERTAALQEANERLQALSARLQSVREAERTRIAREIHDDLGQMLTAFKIELALLSIRLTKVDDSDVVPLVREQLKSMSDGASTMMQSVKRIASDLRPSLLDDLGLTAAIAWQAQEFQERCGVRCAFTCEPRTFAVDSARSTALFRIVQETLTNVARHAGASNVSITLRADADGARLEIHDDGRGITAAELRSSKSLGLLGIRERARLFDGEVEISSAPNGGTTVRVRIPLHESIEPEQFAAEA